MFTPLIIGLVIIPPVAGIQAADKTVVAVRAFRIAPYEEALRGFAGACGSAVADFVIGEHEGADVAGEVRQLKPRLIVAVGLEALLAVRGITEIPIVYLMVLDPETYLTNNGNVTGVSLGIPPAKQLELIKKVLPAKRRVGTLYNPAKTGRLLSEARRASRKLGLELFAEEINSPKEVPARLRAIKDQIDILWMVPDTTVLTSETIESMLLFSLENQRPLAAFSAKYTYLGALMSMDIDTEDCGKQAGEMAARLLAGATPAAIPRSDPRAVILRINLKTAKKMGLLLSDGILNDPNVIFVP